MQRFGVEKCRELPLRSKWNLRNCEEIRIIWAKESEKFEGEEDISPD
jgi:hypothetical protein